MARGELLRKLFLTHKRGDEQGFHSVALQVAAEEKRKRNNQLAGDLLRILENSSSSGWGRPESKSNLRGLGGALPHDREKRTILVDVRESDKLMRDIVLSSTLKSTVERIIQEWARAELLRSHGLRPVRKLLFCGPPGCGKTLCTDVLAGELSLPILYTRFDAIVSSYLGETAANLRKVFDYASTGRWIIFFDEFDAIGKARDDPNEHGELKRVINSFLQLLDGFDAPCLLVAATNHERLLDLALWRRFDELVYFPRPTVHQIRELLCLKLKNFPHKGLDLKSLASSLKGLSYAEVERICLDSVKTCILEDRDSLDRYVVEREVSRQKKRSQVVRQALRAARPVT